MTPIRVLAVSGPLPAAGRAGSLAPVAEQVAALRRLGVVVEVLEIAGLPRVKYLGAALRLRQQAPRVDLVHAHFGYSAWIALLQRRCPVVVSFMGDDLLGSADEHGRSTAWSRVAVAVNRRVAGAVSATIVKSAAMAAKVATSNPAIIPNGVDLDRFRPMDRTAARETLGWPREAKIALFPANPEFPNKGFELARSAFASWSREAPARFRLETMWGVEPERVPLWLNAADVVVLASHQEGSPNVVKEAIACEVPVVATAVGDVPWLLEGLSECRVVLRDGEAMARALAEVAGRRVEGGRNSLLLKGLDSETVARRVLGVYRRVLRRAS